MPIPEGHVCGKKRRELECGYEYHSPTLGVDYGIELYTCFRCGWKTRIHPQQDLQTIECIVTNQTYISFRRAGVPITNWSDLELPAGQYTLGYRRINNLNLT